MLLGEEISAAVGINLNTGETAVEISSRNSLDFQRALSSYGTQGYLVSQERGRPSLGSAPGMIEPLVISEVGNLEPLPPIPRPAGFYAAGLKRVKGLEDFIEIRRRLHLEIRSGSRKGPKAGSCRQ